MIKTTRRGFMVGCSAAIAAMAGARLNFAAFGSPEAEPNQEILVVVFLRGGCDALSLIAPRAGHPDRVYYEAARPDLKISDSSLLPLGSSPFGLHPSAAGLQEVYRAGNLAIIQAVGMDADTRSHFDAMAYMELGTPGNKSTSTGWITRHLQTASNLPADIIVPTLSTGNLQAQSLSGSLDTLTLNSLNSFNLSTGPWGWHEAHLAALNQLYQLGSSEIYQAGREALNALDYVENATSGGAYQPKGGAVYPNNSFGSEMKLIAQMIKLQLGLRVATIDLGGWDSHESQSYNGIDGLFAGLVATLSGGLNAFFTDLAGCASNYLRRTTVVVMSEFGRRLRENDQRGTDHGHGGMMMVMGGSVNGGLYGAWPGLQTDQLYDRADLAVTTDYRRVLSDILSRRMEATPTQLSQIFPGYSGFSPMNLVRPVDKTGDYQAACQPEAYLPIISR